jgi:hypothetical protein
LRYDIDAELKRYRLLVNGVNDKATVEHLNAFVAALESEKIALHPKSEKSQY